MKDSELKVKANADGNIKMNPLQLRETIGGDVKSL